jgi:hypothetical protein
MSQNQVDKKFDCLEFKQKAQEEIYQDTKNLSQTQQIEYFRQRIESSRLGEWWQSLKNAKG